VLVETVRHWWFEADAWRDPDAQRAFLARMDRYAAEGPPGPEHRIAREEIRPRPKPGKIGQIPELRD
jgi:hypothetical protein